MGLRYQRLGIYPWAHKRIRGAITEISRACGVPDVAMSCFQARGVGLHKTGEACDFQAGNSAKFPHLYPDAREVHNRIAKYVLEHWERLNIRYMAWDGWEYGGSWGGPERKRKQATDYGGSDPWHQHHVHIDFRDGPINADPGIEIGAALESATSDFIQEFIDSLEDDMKLLQGPDGKVWASNGLEKRYISNPNVLKQLNALWGKTVPVSQAVVDSIPTRIDYGVLRQDLVKTKAAMGRTEPRVKDLIAGMEAALDVLAVVQTEVHDPTSKKTLRERTEQTNHAVGRAEKARLEAEKEQDK